jgi:hypothetical protein
MFFKVRKFLLLFLLFSSIQTLATEKPVTIVTYITWFPAFATMNGCNLWTLGELGYERSIKEGVRNYPYPSKLLQERQFLTEFAPSTPKKAFEATSLNLKIQNILDQELSDIKKSGFDVVAIDILPIPPDATNITQVFCGIPAVEYIGKRASLMGLKSTILSDVMNRSGDYPNGRVMTVAEWEKIYQNMIQKAHNWKWYWKKNDKYPIIFQFAAGEGSIMEDGTRLHGRKAILRWNEIKKRLDAKNFKAMYFLDFRSDSIPVLFVNNDANLGGFVFAPGAPQGLVNKLSLQIKNSTHDTVWTVSPGYYSQKLKVFLAPDFSRIHKAYTEAISNGVNKILFITWNDLLEDTDMVPSLNKGDALVKLLAFYNEWFKTRIQPVRDKSILIFASPLRRPETITSHPPVWAQGNGKSYNEDQTHQKIYYWLYTPKGSKSSLNFNENVITPTLDRCTDHRGCITIGSFDLNGRITGSIILKRVNEKNEVFVSEKSSFSITSTKIEMQRSGTGGLEYRYQALEK